MLNCRAEGYKDPVRILPDSAASLPPDCRIARSAADIRTLVAHSDAVPADRLERLRACGVELLPCAARDGRVDLLDMLSRLGALGIDSILLEGGEALNGSFVAQGFVDEYYIFIAPKILGGRDAKTAVGGPGFAKMADAQDIDIRSVEQLGPDILIHGYPKKH